jgi:hypothetical protein
MAGSGQQRYVKVHVLLHSGEADPHWTLTEEGNSRLKALLKDLQTAPKPRWPQLGWRGFLLENNDFAELPEEVRVFQGTIRTESEKQVRYYRDTRGLERWLREEAVKRGIRIPEPGPSAEK